MAKLKTREQILTEDSELEELFKEFDLDVKDVSLKDLNEIAELNEKCKKKKMTEEDDEEEEDSEDEEDEEDDKEEDDEEEDMEESNKAPKKVAKESTKKTPTVKAEDYHFDFTDDVQALISEESELPESFKEKAVVIFESAVNSKVNSAIKDIEAKFSKKLSEEKETFRKDINKKLDGYLSYVSDEWMKENKLVIENGLRTEIAEEFISALHTLFEEHYIEVPDSKVDLVDKLAEKVEKLEKQLDLTIAENVSLSDSVKNFKRESLIQNFSEDLSDTEKEKFRGLVESVNFDNEKAFAKKVKIIKESHFRKGTPRRKLKMDDSYVNDNNNTITENGTAMDLYAKAMKQLIK